jgi:lon-related putative ATP-dependent protease
MGKSSSSGDDGKARELQPGSPPRELEAEETNAVLGDGLPEFRSTEELEPLDEIIGQDRAMAALEIGLGIPHEGYNIYVAGLTGTGKTETIRRSLQKRLEKTTAPHDWVYVNNFDDPDEPWAIQLQAGKGRQLKKDMERLVDRLREALPKAFREQDFSAEKEQLGEKYQARVKVQTDKLNELAKQKNFRISSSPDGGVAFIPLVGGEPLKSREEFEKLSDKEKERIRQGETDLAKEAARIMQQQRDMMQDLSEEIRDVERRFGANVVEPMIESIKASYRESDRVIKYLDGVGRHMLDNLSDFREPSGGRPGAALMESLAAGLEQAPRFLEYQVNVVVDHSQSERAPVIIEETPTYRNLFGSIDRTVDQRGRLVTNFTQIKAGSLLRASGGYLVFNIEDALTEPYVYKSLKRALKSSYIQLEAYNPWVPFTTGGMRPEPIKFNTKVVVLGSPMLYYMLRFYDEEFASIFKIRSDFGTEMPREDTQQAQYARFVAKLARDEDLRHFTKDAVAEVIRFACRRVGDKNKLLTRFSEVADLLREADYFARAAASDLVESAHVRKALESRIYRSDRIAEKIRELISEGVLLVDTEGSKIGQINGLAVYDVGDVMFGRPSRVTASVGLGSEGVINIEREAKLSGSTHDKGVLILAGYLRNKYGGNKPLALSASLCFEQSYGGVDGDSASSTELFALLSNLARVPLRQDIAVTGSVNQWGEIQAIGGVNEKIEGFFDVCRVAGLTGKQGVCIPASNVRSIVLRDDVRKAIEGGRFHIYPIETIEEGLELMTGVKAGSPEEEGTLHHLVDSRLRSMAEELRSFGAPKETRVVVPAGGGAKHPEPPKTPDDQP